MAISRFEDSSSSTASSSLQSISQCSRSAADLHCAARLSNCPNNGAICGQSPRSMFWGTKERGLYAGNFPNGSKLMCAKNTKNQYLGNEFYCLKIYLATRSTFCKLIGMIRKNTQL